ncbi:hypothetical protein F5148DRAFT_1213068 [Russula earlei]|uniref:Uncharacterized protein n=1 Tax=Russula earlei TaxID=71964 RepID=A0ACC0U5J1_9AGAM|nr:hypothetical protein F5148DRAFT_1213068 [Russula earlei]
MQQRLTALTPLPCLSLSLGRASHSDGSVLVLVCMRGVLQGRGYMCQVGHGSSISLVDRDAQILIQRTRRHDVLCSIRGGLHETKTTRTRKLSQVEYTPPGDTPL